MKFKQIKTDVRHKFPLIARYGDAIKQEVTGLLAPLQRMALKSLIRSYHAGSTDVEVIKMLTYLDHHPVRMIPYDFVDEYDANSIVIRIDDSTGYPWVEVSGRKVFFPKEFSREYIRTAVCTALMEQDVRSPHCYNAGRFCFNAEGAGVFVGASDGMYCLSVLEHFHAVYLFEADDKWLVPLSLTFAPWKEKVRVIRKFISDRTIGNEITLDDFSGNIDDEITYVQADIEGAEIKLLAGGSNLLAQPGRLKLSLCCYHRNDDNDELRKILLSHGFSLSYSLGYMILWNQVPLRKPYVRRGVIYAEKRNRGMGCS